MINIKRKHNVQKIDQKAEWPHSVSIMVKVGFWLLLLLFSLNKYFNFTVQLLLLFDKKHMYS